MAHYENLQECVAAVRSHAKSLRPQIGVILGSGLGAFADSLTDSVAIPYSELPHFPTSSVPGHAGRLVVGKIGGVDAVVMSGRVHAYEGYSGWQVGFPTRVMCSLGIKTLVVTNAAGGINANFKAGDLMVISDHINFAGSNVLTGHNDDRLGPRFPDMSHGYAPELQKLVHEIGLKQKLSLQKGVYAMVPGPSYETPAEIRMLRVLGADAVGMSTVPEVVVASHMGVKVAGVSCITNLAAGISPVPLSHAEVSETANRVRDAFVGLLAEFVPAAAKRAA